MERDVCLDLTKIQNSGSGSRSRQHLQERAMSLAVISLNCDSTLARYLGCSIKLIIRVKYILNKHKPKLSETILAFQNLNLQP